MANTAMFVNDFEADEKEQNSDVAFNSSVKNRLSAKVKPNVPEGPPIGKFDSQLT
jgi:hypothetical protein